VGKKPEVKIKICPRGLMAVRNDRKNCLKGEYNRICNEVKKGRGRSAEKGMVDVLSLFDVLTCSNPPRGGGEPIR